MCNVSKRKFVTPTTPGNPHSNPRFQLNTLQKKIFNLMTFQKAMFPKITLPN